MGEVPLYPFSGESVHRPYCRAIGPVKDLFFRSFRFFELPA